MTEPQVLDQIIECPDCGGTGEQPHEWGVSGMTEPSIVMELCECCGGAGEVSLCDLEAKR